MEAATINLQDYITQGSKVFSGRDRGKYVRNESKIDELILSHDLITIIVPEVVRTINPSFLEEFLMNIVKKFGLKIYDRIKFDTLGQYQIKEDLEEAVDSLLREQNGIAR